MYDVIIIGGGAAGCVAAIIAAQKGRKTALIESGRLLHKLLLTGKGRCNLTNNSDNENHLRNIKTNPRFMQSSLNAFSAQDVMSFFESLNVPLKTERGNRVFPSSGRAEDVVNALISRLNKCAEVINDRAVEILTNGSTVAGVKCTRGVYNAMKIILATGGLSYPKTGSTGDGYKFTVSLGHTVIKPKPALVPVNTCEDVSEMAGLSLRNVKLSLFTNNINKPLYSEQGEMLFTHFGISGPLVLTASCFIRSDNITPYRFIIDLKPALNEKMLDTRILRDFGENKNKQLQNALEKLLPKKLIPFIIRQTGIPPENRVHEITASERKMLLEALKGFTLNFKSLCPIDEAVITDGGVDVKEINPKTMESKLLKGLHFAGEIIDVAAFTGGYNLQIAFSTAFAAAQET